MNPNLARFSYLKSTNADYIDEVFRRYTTDPDSVDESWRFFFEGMELGGESAVAPPLRAATGEAVDFSSEAKVAELITSYRERGKLLAHINPLSDPPSRHPLLDLGYFGLADSDLGRTFTAGKLIGLGPARLPEILAALKETYCGSIAVEFTHIQNPEERDWLQKRMESQRNREALDSETRKFILNRLSESEGFERFLHTRYVAQKRFSIEGGESTIPTLDCVIEKGAELGVEEVVLGMAHRGRLNVLANVFGKRPEVIFSEFEGAYKADTTLGEGDVKYHMGFSTDFTTRQGKKVHLSLASNPSHLEVVNPVIEGTARAKQEARGGGPDAKKRVLPVLIHGDAAFAGQGVIYETLNLSQLAGYGTGGTFHLVINNQVGFTTSPKDSRSTTYCTDIAMMLGSPIFHVNGDDPEALWYVTRLCMEYRQKFGKDAFIDLVCYRKHGHNEGDEPSFTQPLLYRGIKAHPSTRELYAKSLAAAGVLTMEESTQIVERITETLSQAQAKTKAESPKPTVSAFSGSWKGLRRATDEDAFIPVKTQVAAETLVSLAEKINRIPADFKLHPKLGRFFEAREKAVRSGQGIDWGNGEALAFATLLAEGHPVRLSGQDAERGTFTHRHSVLYDHESGAAYTPLNQLGGAQARYDVHNSHLSEAGVLGFEYGYALAQPQTLVIWEAQFGDFANGAQIVIDQFLSSSESKWQRSCGLVLLLPHGYEGQGPEHSSCRIERFLQLCGKFNLQVCNLTTPAQLFHALRRQLKREFRKPLIVASPKSLLRHPQAVSKIEDFSKAGFSEVLADADAAEGAKRVLLCTGKVFYDLIAERARQNREKEVAVVRIEQLYPWPTETLASVLSRFQSCSEFTWVQEEPRNMGAWTHVFSMWSGGLDQFGKKVGGRAISYVGREIGAAPAVGSAKIHEREQAEILKKAISP